MTPRAPVASRLCEADTLALFVVAWCANAVSPLDSRPTSSFDSATTLPPVGGSPSPAQSPSPASVRARWLFGAMAVAIGYLALVPTPLPTVGTGWDKLNHVIAFAALVAVGCRAWGADDGSRGSRWAVLAGVFGYGAMIEVVQYYVPGRSAEWADLAADGAGILCGAWIFDVAMPAGRQVRERLAVPFRRSRAAVQRVADPHREPRPGP